MNQIFCFKVKRLHVQGQFCPLVSKIESQKSYISFLTILGYVSESLDASCALFTVQMSTALVAMDMKSLSWLRRCLDRLFFNFSVILIYFSYLTILDLNLMDSLDCFKIPPIPCCIDFSQLKINGTIAILNQIRNDILSVNMKTVCGLTWDLVF